MAFRVTVGGPDLERDLNAFLHVEASGWKARRGTAIVANPRTDRLYRSFATRAAARGQLRLALPRDLGCVVGDTGFLLKTGFDESYARLSPGLMLRGEVLRTCVEEGLT